MEATTEEFVGVAGVCEGDGVDGSEEGGCFGKSEEAGVGACEFRVGSVELGLEGEEVGIGIGLGGLGSREDGGPAGLGAFVALHGGEEECVGGVGRRHFGRMALERLGRSSAERRRGHDPSLVGGSGAAGWNNPSLIQRLSPARCLGVGGRRGPEICPEIE